MRWLNEWRPWPASGVASTAPVRRKPQLRCDLLECRVVPDAGFGLLGQYFDNMDFTGLHTTRVDGQVSFNWGTGTPVSGMGADTFTVRWSGQIEPRYSETYTFTVTGDDGYRLWVNGQRIINRWVNQSATATSGTIALVAGRKYDIVFEYYENTGSASVRLEWQSPSQPREVVPASRLFPAERGSITREVWTGISGTSVSNLTGNASYPNGPNSVSTLTSFDAPVNVADNYGQRIHGYLHVPQTGAYKFYVAGDDNCELWLSNSADPAGAALIARVPGWTSHREWAKYPEQRSAVVRLVAGQTYYIRALQKEGGGGDSLSVGWVRPGQSAVEVIPGEFLSPALPTVSLFAETTMIAEGGG